MFRKSLVAAAAVVLLSAAASAQTADEIIDRHIKARGGAEKLKSVKAIRMTGRIELGGGLSAPVLMELKRPKFARLDFTIQGMTGTQVYDNGTGWKLVPWEGKKDAEPLGTDDLKDMAETTDWEGPLVDYKSKGHKIDLIGKESAEGTDAYKLKVTKKGGDVINVYLDADSFLEIKSESKRMIRGSEVEMESASGDYKEAGGVYFPYSIEVGAKGSAQKQKITIDKIEINPEIADARFKMPAPAKPAAGNAPAATPENKETETKPADKRPDPSKPPVKPPVG